MSKSRVTMNPNLERDLAQMAFDAFKTRLQPALDELLRTHGGRSVEEIRPELQRVWTANTGGESITDPELTTFATQIRQGGRIVLRQGK